MNKRGYYYALDVTLAVIIIIIGLIFVMSKFSYSPEKLYAEQISTDMLSVLQDVRLDEVCTSFSPCSCSYSTIETLCSNGEILNQDITILDYLGELYSRGLQDQATLIIEEIFVTNEVVPENYDFVINIAEADNPSVIDQLYPLVP